MLRELTMEYFLPCSSLCSRVCVCWSDVLGASPAASAAEWLESINKAIENYRNVGGSTAASAIGQKGLVNLADVLGKNAQSSANVQNAAALQTMAPPPVAAPAHGFSPSPGYSPVASQITTSMAPPPTIIAPSYSPQPMYNPGPIVSSAPVMQTNFGYAPATTTTYASTPAFQSYAPAPMTTTTYVQQPPMMQTVVMQPTYMAPPPQIVVQQPTMTYTTYNPMY